VSRSTLTARTVTHVPAREGRTLKGSATVDSVDPGTSAPENRMSWLAWSITGFFSGGTMSNTAAIRQSHAGTTPNTGGANRPDR